MAGLDPLHSLVPVREFGLIVHQDLLPFTLDPRKGYTSVKMANGQWFNTRARKPATQALAQEYAKVINVHIKELVQAEARKLQTFWRAKVPQYFNRRAYGMFFSKKSYPRRTYHYTRQARSWRPVKSVFNSMRGFHGPLISGDYLWRTRGSPIHKKFTNRQQFPGRHRTGQLRRALDVKNISSSGCLLVVKPCYASTGRRVDYVKVLMYGASAKPGTPYVPGMDRRIKAPRGRWGGISDMYWKRWQHTFQQQVDAANDRLHLKISEYLVKMQVMQKSDARRVLEKRKTEKHIDKTKTEKKSRKGVSGIPVTPNSPYNKGRIRKSYGGKNRYVKRTPWEYNRNPYDMF